MHNISLTDASHWGHADYMAEGLVLTQTFDRSVLSQGPVSLNFIVMALCVAGSASYTVDTCELSVKPGDLLFISERHVVDNYDATPDFECLFIMVSTQFYHSFVLNVKNVSSLLLFSMKYPVVALTPQEIKVYTDYYHTLRMKMADTKHHYRLNLVKALLLTMFYDMSNVIWRVEQTESKVNRRAEAHFAQFIRLLEDNFRTERRVGWYAEQLNISPKYLSELVKRVSKRTPNEWIDSYMMLEIRVLLKNTTKSIKEISDSVNFPNQSFFGKFFKEHMGMSPSDYRRE